jgi:hypothetical protein
MGMWMEGIGSWNGMMMEQARETWLPHYQHYHGQFLTRWAPLINMMPAAELRAMQVGRAGRVAVKGAAVWTARILFPVRLTATCLSSGAQHTSSHCTCGLQYRGLNRLALAQRCVCLSTSLLSCFG